MEFTVYSEIEIITCCSERFFIYWRYTDCYDEDVHTMKRRQVIQYTTGLRVLPVTYDAILEFIKLEEGSRLHLLLEERWPLGNIKKVPFMSQGEIKTISFK